MHRCRGVLSTCEPSVSPSPHVPAAHLGVRDQLLRFRTSCGIRPHRSHRQPRFFLRFCTSTSSRFGLGNGGKWIRSPKTSKHRSERSNRKEGVERGNLPMVRSKPPFGERMETRSKPVEIQGGSRREADDLEIHGETSMDRLGDLDGKHESLALNRVIRSSTTRTPSKENCNENAKERCEYQSQSSDAIVPCGTVRSTWMEPAQE